MSSSGRRATNRPSRKERMSKGEFNSVAQANGGMENMINWEGKDKHIFFPEAGFAKIWTNLIFTGGDQFLLSSVTVLQYIL